MSDRKARILIITSSYPPVVGGVQTVAHSVALQLSTNGHEVRVVTNRYPVSLPPKENIDGVKVERLLLLSPAADQLRRKRPDLFFASFYFYPRSYWRLKRILERFRPDVLNVHYPDHQIPFVLRLRRQFDFRLVVSLHGHDIEQTLNEPEAQVGIHAARPSASVRRRLRAILAAADAVTACSSDLLNKAYQVEPAIAGKSLVINNGIDPMRFHERESYCYPRPYVLAIGRLTHKKGFDVLIDAFAKDQAQGWPDLIIAGDGEELDSLRAQVQRLGLSRNIRFFGEASNREVVKLLNGCLNVVVPSRREPFGIVALEGLAAGKPVLATRVGGLPELLEGADALLVPPDDSSQLALAIKAALQRSKQEPAFGLRNRQIAARFSAERMIGGYLRAYQGEAAGDAHS
ncbi:MAG TPA: glycosyltransferase family 4 protein [Pyrinomonadaceae bacterium]|nr:glycosyltransferase family 4 protein [Pyrinomonadaceae bacterium]